MTKRVEADRVVKKNRPQSIILFEILFWGSLAVPLLDIVYHCEQIYGDMGGLVSWGTEMTLVLAVVVTVSFATPILLWYFIARRASGIAKWIYTVFLGVGLVAMERTLTELTISEILFSVITQVMALGSVILLFRTDSRIWFETKGRIAHSDVDDLKDIFR
ncbi:hypothetical protein NYA22BAC_03036 [Parasphingorhabdus sp. NYA22]